MSFLGRAAVAAALALPLGAADAAQIHDQPQGETPWVEAFHAKARMIAGKEREREGQKLLLAGIHVRLDEGWKTYWRHPGDAGLPPNFDWSGSHNVKSVRVLWPAPKRYADPAGASIGYAKEVVFPVLVEPQDWAQPVDLALKLEYAVCKDICIPAEAALKLMFGPGGKTRAPHEPLLETSLRQVPPVGEADDTRPRIAKLKIDLTSETPSILVDAVFPGGSRDADLFIEGPKNFYVPLAERVGDEDDGKVRFRVDLTKGDDPKGLKGKDLTFTLVSQNGNAQVTRSVD